MNAKLGSFVLSEQVQSNTFAEGEILGRMFLPFAIQVFAETDIQSPMQFVFDAPVLAYRLVEEIFSGKIMWPDGSYLEGEFRDLKPYNAKGMKTVKTNTGETKLSPVTYENGRDTSIVVR